MALALAEESNKQKDGRILKATAKAAPCLVAGHFGLEADPEVVELESSKY